uniref:Uncharacterized protein n=1 Tax=Arundo donax TaxID=35708 RepID=A0A0A8YEA3_ARUDO
MHALTFWK